MEFKKQQVDLLTRGYKKGGKDKVENEEMLGLSHVLSDLISTSYWAGWNTKFNMVELYSARAM